MNTIDRNEWEQWQKLCKFLLEIGAVTEADLASSTTAPADSVGRRLFNEIREWGDLRFEQGREHSHTKGY